MKKQNYNAPELEGVSLPTDGLVCLSAYGPAGYAGNDLQAGDEYEM